jgi:hypothetical protein
VRVTDTTNQVYNATGTNNGIPYIDKIVPVPARESVAILVQYYVPNPRSVPNPTLLATPLPFSQTSVAPQITRISSLPDGISQIDFASQSGRFYFVQHTEDFARWVTDPVPVKAAGPTTNALQSNGGGVRFYRIMLVP